MPNANRRQKDNKYDTSLKGQYRRMKTGHNSRGKFISFKHFTELKLQSCKYCGQSICKSSYSIDRVDSRKGYTKHNSVPCCTKCNYAKSFLSLKEFKKHIKIMYLHIFGK